MITIHCGLHKTGSTAIQLALAALPKRRQPHVFVPRPNVDRSSSGWRTRLRTALSYPDAIFSDENLLGSPYEGYSDAKERAELLAEVLRGKESQVIVYLRPQHSWLPSVFTQAAQEGIPLEAEAFLEVTSGSPWLRWSNLVEMLRDVCSDSLVIPRPYLSGIDVVEDFFHTAQLGEVPNFGKARIWANVSIPAVQIPILRAMLTDSHLSDLDGNQLRTLFQDVFAPGAPKGYSPFSEVQQTDTATRYRKDWRLLSDLTASNSPELAEQMARVASDWPAIPTPDLAGGLENPVVIREMLRCIGILAPRGVHRRRSLVRRALDKLRTDPFNAPAALGRLLRD